MPKIYTVVRQDWEESEAGWGCRPDDSSLHLSAEDCRVFKENYWKLEKELNTSGQVPHEYTRPCGEPYLFDVDHKTYVQIKRSKGKGTWVSYRLEPYRGQTGRKKLRLNDASAG